MFSTHSCVHEDHTNMKMDIRMSDNDDDENCMWVENRDEIVRCWPFHFSPKVMSILWVAY